MRPAPRSTGPGCLLTSLEEKPALEDVGAKAYNLARLRCAGHCVPEAVVLTTAAFRRFLETNSLDGAIASLRSGLDAGNITGIRRASRSIRELVLEAEMPDDVRAPLEAWYDARPDGRLVVRSSGVGEDGPGTSFAGQLDSFLDIGDLDALRWAVQACWASYWSERALAYQLGRGARLQGMGVLVQLRVDARFAGVLFTRSPDPADSSSMLVEYCAGLGDVLVNGTVTPGRLSMSRESHRWTVHQGAALPTGVDATALLNDSCLGRLRRTALEIEELFGGPQDIEWALDPDGRLQILQARPITTLAGSSTSGRSVPAGMTVWSNANVDENFPEPISPLLYSIARLGYEHYFRNLAFAFGLSRRRIDVMEPAFPGLIGVHAGRMYYNLTNVHTVLRLAPYGEQLAAAFDQFVGTENCRSPHRDIPSFGRVRRLLEGLSIVAHTGWQYALVHRRVAAFERTVDDFADRTRPADLVGKASPDLLELLRAFVTIRCHRWKNASLADAAAMVCYAVLEKLLRRAFPSPDAGVSASTLLKGLRDIVSNEPVLALWELSRLVRDDPGLRDLFASRTGADIAAELELGAHPEFRVALDEYLDHWGFRCPAELMLTVPDFRERPADLLEILKVYVGLDGDSPADTLRREKAKREVATAGVLRSLRDGDPYGPLVGGIRAAVLHRVIRATQGSIALRERARLKQALLYSRLRTLALSIGETLVRDGHLDEPAEVFFLSVDELDELLDGRAMFPDQVGALVELRRTTHAEFAQQVLPDTLTLRTGSYVKSAATSAGSASDEATTSLTGVGVSGGCAEGPAIVLKDVREATRIQRGQILVTRQTDPAWAPFFFLIDGLVLERGGMLSHGSILAREYGLPSVVGIRHATERIRNGQSILVDGDHGVVATID